jgi:WD40 repeat protein|tara:strand:+ start:822 stop:1142 length:321 start_codon:yes stop_codon:yes gene_type:complete
LSTAEDFTIKVWDLVLKKDVAVMKPKGKEDSMAHRTTTMLFTGDKKTLVTAGLDGCIHFWNVMDNFKLVSSISATSLGALRYEEILSMVYLNLKDDPCLVLGGHSG